MTMDRSFTEALESGGCILVGEVAMAHDGSLGLAHAFIDALHAARPQVPREQAAWAYQFALGALLHHISDQRVHRLSHGANRPPRRCSPRSSPPASRPR